MNPLAPNLNLNLTQTQDRENDKDFPIPINQILEDRKEPWLPFFVADNVVRCALEPVQHSGFGGFYRVLGLGFGV